MVSSPIHICGLPRQDYGVSTTMVIGGKYRLSVAARTADAPGHIGNEDNFLISPGFLGIYDGVGGNPCGELASYISSICYGIYSVRSDPKLVQWFLNQPFVTENPALLESLRGFYASLTPTTSLEDVMQATHCLLNEESDRRELLEPMATTFAVVDLTSPEGRSHFQGNSQIAFFSDDGGGSITNEDSSSAVDGRNRKTGARLSFDEVLYDSERHYLRYAIGGIEPNRDRAASSIHLYDGMNLLLFTDGLEYCNPEERDREFCVLDAMRLARPILGNRSISCLERVNMAADAIIGKAISLKGGRNFSDECTILCGRLESLRE